ncbi:sugar kinase [Sphingomonas sp. OK281]|uniref:sugar kinase n=1 Tax=Sphingomonas sp. OK281 TaxID=1881067 RepID=UPI0008E8A4CD|nr:sugar kinase [Sphingomonas sp. OK281]SFN71574.1 2-dehydro-3-deoxygluconokinase [Sphingomonas sp. OK281]
MTDTLLCFGEMLLRLAAPDRGHLFQDARLDAHFGGAEANVAVALARIGAPAALITTLPHGPLGDAALETVRAAGVDVSRVQRADGRLGLYFLSPPSGARGAHIVYDRLDSSFAVTPSEAYDWPALLDGVSWLHLSGIIPAIGPAAARLSLDAIVAARAAGVKVSFDGNFRASMWARWCPDPQPILLEHVASADLLFGNHRDIALLLGEPFSGDTPATRRAACEAAFARFPQLGWIASTARQVVDADTHRLSARVDRRKEWFETETIAVTQIVDRIGTGDAFAAGVLSCLEDGCSAAAERGLGLAALKHATAGDQSRTTSTDLAAFTGMPSDVRR